VHLKCIEASDFASVILDENSKIIRTRARPEKLRHSSYDEEYDFHCIFYDGFLMEGSNQIRFIGPPLFNFKEYVENGIVEIIDFDGDEEPKILNSVITDLQKAPDKDTRIQALSRWDIFLDQAVSSIELRMDFGKLGEFFVKVSSNDCNIFEDRRVAFTLFKFEPMHWLKDWAEFNVKYHKANALLVYHNTSVFYDTKEICDALRNIDGLEALVVAHWPYKYGPQALGTKRWDSNFCQIGMFDQVRWRFFSRAKSVLNGDIDELVVTLGHKSVFELVEESESGYLQFEGIVIAGIGDSDCKAIDFNRRHKDFFRLGDTPHGGAVGGKWVVVPSRVLANNQWFIHGIKKQPKDRRRSEMVTLCHFMGISTYWKPDANRSWLNERKCLILEQAFIRIGWLT